MCAAVVAMVVVAARGNICRAYYLCLRGIAATVNLHCKICIILFQTIFVDEQLYFKSYWASNTEARLILKSLVSLLNI